MLSNDAYDFLAQFQPLNTACFGEVTDFLFTQRLPRYFLAPTVLMTYNFFFSVVDDCLLVLKAEWISGNPVLYLLFPPIHKLGNLLIEKEILMYVLNLGIDCKLSDYELQQYSMVAPADKETEKEFIYQTVRDFSGEKYKPFRNVLNRISKHKITVVSERQSFSEKTLADAKLVLEYWGTAHDKSIYRPLLRLKNLNNYVTSCGLNVSLQVSYDENQNPFDYTLCEGYNHTENCNVVIVNRYYREIEAIKDMAVYEQIIDFNHWHGIHLFNSGGIRGNARIYQSKHKLRPLHVMNIYRFGFSVSSVELKAARQMMTNSR